MNIFLTSVGRRSYMLSYFLDALAGVGKLFAGNSEDTYALRLADEFVITPKIYDKTYISFIIDYCKKQKINAIIPLFDLDIPVLALNKEKFRAIGVQLFVPNFEIAQVCNDKWKTFKFLRSFGINTMRTWVSLNDFFIDFSKNKVAYPIIVKPRWGMGSIGIYEATTEEELKVFFNKVHRDVFDTYLKYESSFDPKQCVLIQEKISGNEFGLDVLNDIYGSFMTCIPKRKLAMRAGETDMAEIIQDQKLEALGFKLSQILKHVGNLDVDCFKVNGEYYVLEMNCRFGGQYPFAHLAGANFPKAIVNLLLNKPVPVDLLKAKPGVVGCKDLNPVVFNK